MYKMSGREGLLRDMFEAEKELETLTNYQFSRLMALKRLINSLVDGNTTLETSKLDFIDWRRTR
jgi:hypothetical protein